MRFFYKIGNVFLEGNSLSDLFKLFGPNSGLYNCDRFNSIRPLLVSIMTQELRKVIFVIVMIGASLHCGAQSLLDKSNMTIGKIGSDGYVYNRSNMIIGRFKSDGYIVDKSNMMVGRIREDGSILDRSNMTIGKVDSDGTVKDRNNMTLGRIKSDGYVVDRNNITIGRAKDVPVPYAAVFFFFNLFQ